tara:strand:- start:50 stop:163 length:114 start_codon:yes stop_codon:yes gene_type:complete
MPGGKGTYGKKMTKKVKIVMGNKNKKAKKKTKKKMSA